MTVTRTVLYVAASLDGRIADAAGGVDWLAPFQVEGQDYGWGEFWASVDGAVMGRTTYDQVLGFGAWPYGDTPCWVLSRRELAPSRGRVERAATPAEVLERAGASGVARLWIVGGGSVVRGFLELGRLDEVILSWIPVVLGAGAPLFPEGTPPASFVLRDSRSYPSGLVQARYEPASARELRR